MIMSPWELACYEPVCVSGDRDTLPEVRIPGFSAEEEKAYVVDILRQRRYAQCYAKLSKVGVHSFADAEAYAARHKDVGLRLAVERDMWWIHELVSEHYEVYELMKGEESGPRKPPRIRVAMECMVAVKTGMACTFLECSMEKLIGAIAWHHISLVNYAGLSRKHSERLYIPKVELVFEWDPHIAYEMPEGWTKRNAWDGPEEIDEEALRDFHEELQAEEHAEWEVDWATFR